MNPKQKAEELILKFTHGGLVNYSAAKKDAILCVQQIIEAIEITTGHCELRRLDLMEVKSDIKFWEDVIKELEK